MEFASGDQETEEIGEIEKDMNLCDIDMTDLLQEITGEIDDINIQDAKEERHDLSHNEMETFSREASKSFFDQWGLVTHQIQSFNDFMTNGLQKVFDNLGELNIEPDYNPTNKVSDGKWRHASVAFGKVYVEKPVYYTKEGEQKLLMPAEARIRNMTYSSPVYVDMNIRVYLKEPLKLDSKSKCGLSLKDGKSSQNVEEHKKVLIGRIPIMVKSNLCHLYGADTHKLYQYRDCGFDVGGYFIIKGSEKVFIAQEERCNNRIWVQQGKSGLLAVYNESSQSYSSNMWEKVIVKFGNKSKKTAKGDENSVKDDAAGYLYRSENEEIFVSFFVFTMPAVLLFYALGVKSDLEMVQIIGIEESDQEMCEYMLTSIYQAENELKNFRRRDAVMKYMENKLKSAKYVPSKTVEELLDYYLFPQLQKHSEKALFLGYMIKCLLLCHFGRRQVENKDDYRNKRLQLAGELLGRQMNVLLRQLRARMKKHIQKDISGQGILKSIDIYVDASIITNGLVRSFSTGNWSHPSKQKMQCTGVISNLKQVNPLQVVSEMRRLTQWVQYSAKLGDARYPNPSYWGRVCFISTPDGEKCGLVKNLAVTCLVSVSSREETIIDALRQCGMIRLDHLLPLQFHSKTKIFLNGKLMGACDKANIVVKTLQQMRRNQCLDPFVEIKSDDEQKEIRIFSDAGRLLRPLLIVKNQKLCINKRHLDIFRRSKCPFQYLVENGIIEFLGVEEEEDAQIACGVDILSKAEISGSYPTFTHCELDPSFLLSLNASLIPFANRNLATRVLFQSEKHSRQAMGYYTMSPQIRCDTSSQQLFYPQSPLFWTLSSRCLSKPQFYNGQNAIVAVNVHYGYNQEDSLVASKAAIDRGLFRSLHFRSFTSETEHDHNFPLRRGIDFGKPHGSNLRIEKLDEDGFPQISSYLHSGDVLIGKAGPQPSDSNYSVKLKHTEKGRVDQVVVTANDDGKKYARVRLREMRYPSLGDKFSSMHGQKGVIGFIEQQENMPFTKEGIVPDLIINPHAFPSRQTPGQLFECALAKALAISGDLSIGDATPFRPVTVDFITSRLKKYGYEQWGKEQMYNGRNGGALKMKIFVGPTFYQRLIHMAEDKLKYRNHGPVHPLTRQPVHDRKRYGGLKFGEMERDCMLAHGATANLLERLFYLSDFSTMHICSKCQMVAPIVLVKDARVPYCNFCKTAKYAVKVNIPYACKLLYQELFAMGICLKFQTELC